jgi:type I restriction enzyme S subunit
MASSQWQPRKLDELGFVGRGKSRHRPRNAAFLYGGRYPFFQTGDIKAANFYLTEYTQTYSEEGLAQSKLWKTGTLCITIAANIAESAILGIEGCFPDSVVGFVADPAKADVRFIKYYLEILKLRMQNISHGATQDNLSLDKLLSFDFLVPPLPIQRRIAGILSAYDELIENSQRRIKILEAMARALYREWFVHFRFPGHESVPRVPSPLGDIPQGWEATTLGRLVEIRKGRNITKGTIRDGSVPVVAGGIAPAYFHDTSNTQSPVITISASGANAGFVRLYHVDVWASDCSYIDLSATPHVIYFYLWLDHRRAAIRHLQRGSAQPHVYPKDLAQLEAVRVPDSLLFRFSEQVAPIFGLTRRLGAAIENLRRTRDLLLPRLLTGQLDVEAMAS